MNSLARVNQFSCSLLCCLTWPYRVTNQCSKRQITNSLDSENQREGAAITLSLKSQKELLVLRRLTYHAYCYGCDYYISVPAESIPPPIDLRKILPYSFYLILRSNLLDDFHSQYEDLLYFYVSEFQPLSLSSWVLFTFSFSLTHLF